MHACGCVLAYADKLLCMIIHLFTTSIIVAIMLHTNTAPASPDPMSYNLKYTDIPLRQYTLLSQALHSLTHHQSLILNCILRRLCTANATRATYLPSVPHTRIRVL